MEPTEPTAAAEALERYLGDPRAPASRISFEEAHDLDEREAFPERAVDALNAWGLQRFYVPEASGGALRSFEVLAALIRTVARRDVTATVAHAKTFLGAATTWVAGTAAQREALGAAVSRGAVVSLGLTEEAHGGDLFATGTTATPAPAGYLLSGEKWLINNATRCEAITVLARTDPRGGPRGCSLFLVWKRDAPGHAPLPKIRTHGIRGADIGGIRFTECPVPASARIGDEGHGLEIMMKAFQMMRVLVPSISLGALDTGLRHVLAFARDRRIGVSSVAEIPHARRILTEAFVELLAADAIVRSGARSIHVAPERLPIASAVVKYLVPVRADAALHRLAVVLGARHYLRAAPFEKLLRDHAVVALFDGSTVVNLNALGQELPRVARERSRSPPGAQDLRDRLAALYDLRRPLPAFRPDRLDLVSRGADDVVPSVAMARAWLDELPEGAVEPDVRATLRGLAAHLDAELASCVEGFRTRERSSSQSPEAFASAERYARLHGAAACLQVWLHTRTGLDAFFGRAEWLALALFQLLGEGAPPPPAALYDRVFARLEELSRACRSFALEPGGTDGTADP
jgi:alkylation response protein AidB-like acyl-CoA dehydrogenase